MLIVGCAPDPGEAYHKKRAGLLDEKVIAPSSPSVSKTVETKAEPKKNETKSEIKGDVQSHDDTEEVDKNTVVTDSPKEEPQVEEELLKPENKPLDVSVKGDETQINEAARKECPEVSGVYFQQRLTRFGPKMDEDIIVDHSPGEIEIVQTNCDQLTIKIDGKEDLWNFSNECIVTQEQTCEITYMGFANYPIVKDTNGNKKLFVVEKNSLEDSYTDVDQIKFSAHSIPTIMTKEVIPVNEKPGTSLSLFEVFKQGYYNTIESESLRISENGMVETVDKNGNNLNLPGLYRQSLAFDYENNDEIETIAFWVKK
ncbi:MAG: hypothetical protein CL678_03565 [Bdellovibrionaceae bacterium]|nr:hypothetical protein [Pseudobdellovibrionaceae bacterium]